MNPIFHNFSVVVAPTPVQPEEDDNDGKDEWGAYTDEHDPEYNDHPYFDIPNEQR